MYSLVTDRILTSLGIWFNASSNWYLRSVEQPDCNSSVADKTVVCKNLNFIIFPIGNPFGFSLGVVYVIFQMFCSTVIIARNHINVKVFAINLFDKHKNLVGVNDPYFTFQLCSLVDEPIKLLSSEQYVFI